MNNYYNIVVIGGGAGGITASALLLKQNKNLKIAIIEPSETHVYQAAWTLVGGNTFDYDKTIRPESSVMPEGTTWIKEFAEKFEPEHNKVITKTGNEFTYDYLIVAPGIQIDLDSIEGLKKTIGKNEVCSNYIDPKYTWDCIKNFKGGNAVFTQPTTPIKCGGAPQKIMYLADDHFRKSDVREKSNVIFANPGGVIFGVSPFKEELDRIVKKKGIEMKTFFAITKIDGEKKEAYFKHVAPGENQCVIMEDNKLEEKPQEETFILPFDMLHLAPPQSAPDFIKNSPLSNDAGWMDVDINSLQSNKFENIFGLGDVAALPTAKTAAAIRKQAPVVVANILGLMANNKIGNLKYEGYSSCPLVTGYGKMLLAEFGYDNVRMSDPLITKLVDTSKEQWSMWLLKKYGIPYLYWNRLLKGKM